MSTVGLFPRLVAPPPVPRLWPARDDHQLDTFRSGDTSLTSSRSNMSTSSFPLTSSIEGIGVARSNLATALFHAVFNCRASKVKFLLGSGHVPPNIINDQGHNLLMTALYIVDDDRRARVFRYLLRNGVDCCYRQTKTGRDVLALACSLGRREEVRSILDAALGEIDVLRADAQGLTPLHIAVQEGHADVVRMLVNVLEKYKLSVDKVDKQGLTPYMYARRLGRPDIARILVEEGNASVHQRDSLTFRSADDWAVVGAKENIMKQKLELRRQVAYYRIRGMLPPISELREMKKQPPKILLNDDENDEVSGEKSYAPTPDGSQSSGDTNPDLNNKDAFGSPGGLFVPGNKFLKPSPRGKRVHSLMALNHHINQISGPKSEPLSKSVDTAFTLLGLKAEDTMEHATNFVQSELDTSKMKQYSSAGPPGPNVMDQLSDMMQALSDEQSSAFRKVAIAPPTPPKLIPKKKKKKVSTLAILMAKERKQQRIQKGTKAGHHKPVISMSGSKPTKTLSDHAKERKRNKTSPAKLQSSQDNDRMSIKRKAPGSDD